MVHGLSVTQASPHDVAVGLPVRQPGHLIEGDAPHRAPRQPELQTDLGWFWYYWLFTTESVDGSIASVATKGGKTLVTVRQDGEMPSPVVLKVEFASDGPPIKAMANAVVTGNSAIVTWPVDVWFAGSRTFVATLDFGKRKIIIATHHVGMLERSGWLLEMIPAFLDAPLPDAP